MMKQFVDNGPGQASTVTVPALGRGVLVAESAMLSVRGQGRIAAVPR